MGKFDFDPRIRFFDVEDVPVAYGPGITGVAQRYNDDEPAPLDTGYVHRNGREISKEEFTKMVEGWGVPTSG